MCVYIYIYIYINATGMGRLKARHARVPSFFILRGWFWIWHRENCFTLAFTFVLNKMETPVESKAELINILINQGMRQT